MRLRIFLSGSVGTRFRVGSCFRKGAGRCDGPKAPARTHIFIWRLSAKLAGVLTSAPHVLIVAVATGTFRRSRRRRVYRFHDFDSFLCERSHPSPFSAHYEAVGVVARANPQQNKISKICERFMRESTTKPSVRLAPRVACTRGLRLRRASGIFAGAAVLATHRVMVSLQIRPRAPEVLLPHFLTSGQIQRN
jgi:hypothetical protein